MKNQMRSFLRYLRKSLFILSFLFLWATPMYADPISLGLLELLDVMHVNHDGTLPSIVEATQKQWLRPAGKERWEMDDLSPEVSSQVIKLADPIGLIEEIKPSRTSYDYALVFGATIKPMQARFNYLCELWNQGIRFSEVIFLVSQRPLEPSFETIPGCSTESDAARFIWSTATIPDDLRALPVTFIDVAMIKEGTTLRRATSVDTIMSWLAQHPNPGSCLFISNQPYCLYQNAVLKTCMLPCFEWEVVGSTAKIEYQRGSVLLDTIARWLYNELKAEENPITTCDFPKAPSVSGP